MTKKLPPEIKNQRRPTRVACTFCSQKHLQCDDSRPCKNCIKRGFADTCKDAIRKKKKVDIPVAKSKSSGHVPKPRGRPRKGPLPPNKIKQLDQPLITKKATKDSNITITTTPLIRPKSPLNEHQHGLLSLNQATGIHSKATDIKSVDSFSNLNNTGLSSLNLPNLSSLPSFLNTPKDSSFPQPPRSPSELNQQQHQQQQQPNQQDKNNMQDQNDNQNKNGKQQQRPQFVAIPSFSDIKLNSSFWDLKSAGMAASPVSGIPSRSMISESNSVNPTNSTTPPIIATKSPTQLFLGINKPDNSIAASPNISTSRPSIVKNVSSTSLLNILNPSISNSELSKKEESPQSDDPEAPLEFKANTSMQKSKSYDNSPAHSPHRIIQNKSKSKSSTPQRYNQNSNEVSSSEYSHLNELFKSNSTTPNTGYFKRENTISSSGRSGGQSFNAGYANQMNSEMDGLNFSNTSIMINNEDEDLRPFIEINLEEGTMISSYPNNSTPNSFVFNPNHSQMPNTASEIPNDVEQNDNYTSPLIMRHVIKHPDDIYLTSIVKSYQYPQAYHALIAYLKRRFNKLQLLEIAKCMAKYRPSFISATKSLYENDLIFTERSFQRTLLEYEHLISMSPSPTIIWRRTGEIVALTNAFCVMTGYSKMSLLSKRTFIVELMDDESTIKYFRSFSDLAFGDLNATYLTDCNLRKAKDDDYLKCCCVWTIKRDAFDIPMLIVGQFLPVLE